MRFKLLAALLLCASTGAQAAWLRAESKHFVMIADTTEADLKDDIGRFEKFAFALATISGRKLNDSPIKLSIYRVRNTLELQNTMPWPSGGVAGYYNGPIRGPFLVIPRRVANWSSTMRVGNDFPMEQLQNADSVAFHELTHHFMFQNFPVAYPTWYSEGFADYYGTFQVRSDGKSDVVQIGTAQTGRLMTISRDWLPVDKLLTARSYADVGSKIGSLYAQGWLLVHFVANNPERAKQLTAYLKAVNANVSYAEAAKAFGDLRMLDRELQAYARKLPMKTSVYPFKPIDTGAITVRPLSRAEAALWQTDLKLSSGIPRERADGFAREVRGEARTLGDDPLALRLTAEAAALAGDAAGTDAAVARLLVAAPNDAVGLTLRAERRIAQLKAAKAPAADAGWTEARADLRSAIKADPDDARPLKAYYDSFGAAGVMPPVAAQNALLAALQLVPQDDNLRYAVAADFEARGDVQTAIKVIRPIAILLLPDNELSARERRERDRARAKYVLAGEDPNRETPRQMLDRLEKKAGVSTDTGNGAPKTP